MEYNAYTQFVNNNIEEKFANLELQCELLSKVNHTNLKNKQFTVASNLSSFNHVYITDYFTEMLGYQKKDIDPQFFMSIIHPDDLERYQRTRSKIIDLSHTFYLNKEGSWLISSNYRARKSNGDYVQVLYQCYLYFFCAQKADSIDNCKECSVIMTMVITDVTGLIDASKSIHYYAGNDLSLFRFPDTELLEIGSILTKRELEVIILIEEGFTSEEIANKLFLSIKTVNTHRSNILKKLDKSSIVEAIYELKTLGLI